MSFFCSKINLNFLKVLMILWQEDCFRKHFNARDLEELLLNDYKSFFEKSLN